MLPSPLGSGSDLGALDIGGADDPRRPFADLICGKSAFDNQAANGPGTDREVLGRLGQCRLAALGRRPLGRRRCRDVAQGATAFASTNAPWPSSSWTD